MRLEVFPNEGRHAHFGMALTAACGCRFEVEVQDEQHMDSPMFVPCKEHAEAEPK